MIRAPMREPEPGADPRPRALNHLHLTAEDPEGEALGSAGEQVRATRALAPLLRRYSALEPRDARNRCAAALARRGFDYETISCVVAAALAPVPDGRDDV